MDFWRRGKSKKVKRSQRSSPEPSSSSPDHEEDQPFDEPQAEELYYHEDIVDDGEAGASSSSYQNPFGLQPLGAGGVNPNSPAFQYIWLGLPFRILLPAMVQGSRSCSFAAVARQTEYDMKIRHAKEGMDVNVEFNYVAWEYEVRRRYDNGVPNRGWHPKDLMLLFQKPYMLDWPAHVPREQRRRGCGLTVAGSGMTHFCNIVYIQEHPTIDEILKWLTKYKLPLVAIVPNIPGEYPTRGEHCYTNRFNLSREEQIKVRETHAVVLTGKYDTSIDGNPLKLDESKTWLTFQSSYLETDEVEGVSLLPEGSSVLCSSLILHICGTINFPQPAFIHRSMDEYVRSGEQIEAWMLQNMIDHYDQQLQRHFGSMDAIAESENLAMAGLGNLRLF